MNRRRLLGVGRPRISVLLPVFNAVEYLPECLTSLSKQSFCDFEVIAVDDGSYDGSSEKLDRWAETDARIRVLHRGHEGLVAALNAGLGASRAPMVARMDADDVIHPRRLELQLRALEHHPEVDVVSCLVRSFPAHATARGFRLYEEWLNGLLTHDAMAAQRFVEAPLAHPSAVFRKNTIEDAGGYRDNSWPEDYDLWLRLFEKGHRFAKLNQMLYFWRESETRLTRTDPRYSKDAFLRCKAFYLARSEAAPPTSVILWGAGATGRRLMRHLVGEGVTITAVVDIDPAKIGSTLRGRPILSPEDLPDLTNEPNAVVITAVASRGARDLIRGRLRELGLKEGVNFWCAA